MDKQKYEILPDGETLIWRYMNLGKFLSLVQSGKLYFHRADKFLDIFEGSFTQGSLDDHLQEWGANTYEHIFTLSKHIPSFSYVNCWHMSNYESAALWEIYGVQEGAIAIQSSLGKLKKLFPNEIKNEGSKINSQQIVKVQYIDYKTVHPYLNDLVGPLCYKRQAYAYEKEVRIVKMLIPTVSKPSSGRPNGSAINLDKPPEETGILLTIDLNSLIENIYVSPSAPMYLASTISQLLRKYDVHANCKQSSLDDLPEFGRDNI